jgi:hypothetical protein
MLFYQKNFKLILVQNVTLYTIRHFTDAAAQTVEEGKNVILKQISTEPCKCDKRKIKLHSDIQISIII